MGKRAISHQGAQLEVNKRIGDIERRFPCRKRVEVEQADLPGAVPENLFVIEVPMEQPCRSRRSHQTLRNMNSMNSYPISYPIRPLRDKLFQHAHPVLHDGSLGGGCVVANALGER